MRRSSSAKVLTLKQNRAPKLTLTLKTPKNNHNSSNAQQKSLSAPKSCKNARQSNHRVRKIDLKFITSSKQENTDNKQKQNLGPLQQINDFNENNSLKSGFSNSQFQQSKQININTFDGPNQSCFEDLTTKMKTETPKNENWEDIIQTKKHILNTYLYRIDKKLEQNHINFLQPISSAQSLIKKRINLKKNKCIVLKNSRRMSDFAFQKQMYQKGKHRSKKSSMNLI